MKYLRRYNRKAFTLLELIITIVVLGLLASIAIVGYGTVVTRAATSSTEASLMHIDSAVDVTHAMRTAIDGGPRADADFDTAAYGTDGTGDSEIMSSTGTWDLVKADSSDASFDESTVYYALSGGVTGMAKTVIDSSPDGNRYHLSFLKSSFAQTVTWSAWCEITPADLLDMDPGSGNWPHPDCRFEGSFQNNPGNASPAEITDAGTVSPAQDGAFVSPIQFDGYADYVVYIFTPVSDDRPSATPAAETVVSPNYPVPSSGETVSGLIPGVNYTVEAALYFNDPLYGPGLEDAAQLVDGADAPQTVRPYTVPAAPSVTAELTKDNGSADFDATVTVSWADDYAGSAANTGFTPTGVMNFRVEQSLNGGSFSEVTATSTPGNEISLVAGTYSVVVDAVADSVMTFRVVAINDSGLESSTDSAEITVGNIPAVATPIAPTVDPNSLGQNAAYGYDFAWTADATATAVEYSLNGGAWVDLTGSTSGNITGNASANEEVTVEVRARVSGSNAYGSVESDWASTSESFTFGAPSATVSTPSTPTINTDDSAFNSSYYFDFDWNNVGADEQECKYNGGAWTTCAGTTWTGTGSAGSSHTLQVRVRNIGTPDPIYGGGANSAWVESSVATVTFGSPVATPSMPAAITLSTSEAADSTPQVRYTWNATSPYQLQFRTATCSGNNPSCPNWSSYQNRDASSTAYGWFNASFNTTYRFDLRSRNCVSGNAYNTSSTICSGWREVTAVTEYVGSPAATPSAPTAPNVTINRYDTNNRVWVDYRGGNDLEISINGGSYSDLSESDQHRNITPTSSSTVRVRSRSYVAPNAYGGGGWSGYSYSSTLSTWMYPTATSISLQRLRYSSEHNYGTTADARIYFTVNRRGHSGSYTWHVYSGACVDSGSTWRGMKSGSHTGTANYNYGWISHSNWNQTWAIKVVPTTNTNQGTAFLCDSTATTYWDYYGNW